MQYDRTHERIHILQNSIACTISTKPFTHGIQKKKKRMKEEEKYRESIEIMAIEGLHKRE